jgi:hypothetical protein
MSGRIVPVGGIVNPTHDPAVPDLVAAARAASLTRNSIVALAASVAVPQAIAATERCLESGEIQTATALALAVAVAGGRIPLSVVRQLLPDVDDMSFVPIIAAAVEGERIDALLDLVEEGRLSWQREAYLLYLATQLVSGTAPRRLVSLLRTFAREPLGIEAGMLVGLAALALDDPEINGIARQWLPFAKRSEQNGAAADLRALFFSPAADGLPEVEPERMVSGHTVVRSDPKVGRNDPCPCGSGRKYKKCCAGRDQETFGRRTALEEFRSLPAQQSRTRDQIFELMRPGELGQLDPASLTTVQVITAMRKLGHHQRWADAERFMDALSTRDDAPGQGDVDDYRLEVIDEALRAKMLDVAERQIKLASLSAADQTRLGITLALARNEPDALSRLESALATAHKDDPGMVVDCAHALLEHFPAVGILAARGAITAERLLDSQFLLEQVGRARDRLDLPADEPWWDIFDFLLDSETERHEAHDAESVGREREIDSLKSDLAAASSLASRLERDLFDREAELAAAAERQSHVERVERPTTDDGGKRLLELEDERQRLRRKIFEMKGEIAAGATQRADLRRKLAQMAEAQKSTSTATRNESAAEGADDHDDAVGEPVASRPRKVLVPQFTPNAARALAPLPPRVAGDAVQSAAALATGDERAWSGAKHMRRVPDVLTVRLGRSYRLLYRITEERLEVVDVIHRRDLDAALQRLKSRL